MRIAVVGPLGGSGKNVDSFPRVPLGGEGLGCLVAVKMERRWQMQEIFKRSSRTKYFIRCGE